MLTDLEVIKELVQKTKFEKLDKFQVNRAGYQTDDDNNNIIFLSLYNLKILNYSFLKYLPNLTKLNLHLNTISDYSFLKDLPNLTQLNLGSNAISDISFLKDLLNLTHLNLSSNAISDISSLKNLTNLTDLYLNYNKISDISPLKGLSNLTYLYLRNNQIKVIPKEINNLTMDIIFHDILKRQAPEGIVLNDNPLESPPEEIVRKGRNAVHAYFKSLEGEKQALNEVKVLLVGDGGAGKTSLVKQLLGEDFDRNESQTHGINIKHWKINQNENEIKVNLWDFGGQEIMHATHQFFLSKRSLYVLVLDSRKDEKLEYWLKHIESFGGTSPIVIVINKIDENPSFDVNRLFLKEKYESIKGFYRLSCAKKKGIDTFSNSLSEELAKVELLQTTWAKSWINIKTELENTTDHFIDFDEYKAICVKENVLDDISQQTLIDFLNDLGVILHFKDFGLSDTHVLEPKWLTAAVYRIINSETLAKNNGILKLGDLDIILAMKDDSGYHYPKDKYRYIIDIMKKFELCFEIDNNSVLIPDLLEVQETKFDFDYDNSLKFVIEYDFLPRSVMPRFIVKMHKDIKEDLRWRTGVILEDSTFHSTAIVRSDDEAKKIYIYVNGEQKRDYFSVIRHAFLTINRGFEKLKFIEKVPMPDNPEVTVSYDHLARLEQKGIEEYLPDGSEKEYDVKDLLGSIYVEHKTEKEALQLLRKLQDQSDTQETLLEKVNEIIVLQPNFFGLGININQLVNKLINKW